VTITEVSAKVPRVSYIAYTTRNRAVVLAIHAPVGFVLHRVTIYEKVLVDDLGSVDVVLCLQVVGH
jgi:hypothetical protein